MKRALMVVVVALVAGCYRGPDPLAADPNMDVMSIPSFTLTDQTGAERTEAIFKHPGVTVLDFTFTSCTLVCPPMNTQMLRLQRECEDLPVRIVSISVDPERDTPLKLAGHAAALGANTNTWTFLTGDFETVKRICTDGLKLAVGGASDQIIPLAGGGTMNNIPHSQKFVLIRHDGQPIGIYTGTDEQDVDRLIARIRSAF